MIGGRIQVPSSSPREEAAQARMTEGKSRSMVKGNSPRLAALSSLRPGWDSSKKITVRPRLRRDGIAVAGDHEHRHVHFRDLDDRHDAGRPGVAGGQLYVDAIPSQERVLRRLGDALGLDVADVAHARHGEEEGKRVVPVLAVLREALLERRRIAAMQGADDGGEGGGAFERVELRAEPLVVRAGADS